MGPDGLHKDCGPAPQPRLAHLSAIFPLLIGFRANNSIWNTLARADTAAGDEILLRKRGALYEIRFNGLELMSNLNHQSETVLAELSLRLHGRHDARVLIGGLRKGITLRAALELLSSTSEVTVCELIPEIARWNPDRIGHLADRPQCDPRMDLRVADVMEVLPERMEAKGNRALPLKHYPRQTVIESGILKRPVHRGMTA